jgi:hypothetical protein
MDSELLKNSILLITGATIPIVTTFFNNYSQRQREKLRYENDRKIDKERREFEEVKEYKIFLIKSIEDIAFLLGGFDKSISLTSSVIRLQRNMKIEEYDDAYQKELEQLIKLKGIILARFPNFYDIIVRIDGHHNNFWGHQRLLFQMNYDDDKEGYQIMTENIKEIAGKTSQEIGYFIDKLRKNSELINNKYAT